MELKSTSKKQRSNPVNDSYVDKVKNKMPKKLATSPSS